MTLQNMFWSWKEVNIWQKRKKIEKIREGTLEFGEKERSDYSVAVQKEYLG